MQTRQNKCAICSLKTTFGCSQCKQVFYCSVNHQKEHWPIHQQECQLIKDGKDYKIPDEQITKTQNKPSKLDVQSMQIIKQDKKVVINEKDQLQEEHDRYRQISIRILSQKDYLEALQPLKKSIEISKKLEEIGTKEETYEKIANVLLLVRTQINLIDLQGARNTLIQIWDQVKNLTQTQKKTDQVKVCQILYVIAALFEETGDSKKCEQAYVEYILLAEKCYGETNKIIGEAYFLVGTFYFRQQHFTQALACFKRSLNIKMNLDPNNEEIGDCWFNIGQIYRQQNKKELALEFLEKSLKFRKQIIGQNSLQAAQCLETLGRLHLQFNELKNAHTRLNECFNIRKQLLKDPTNPQLEQVSKLIFILYQKIQDQKQKESQSFEKFNLTKTEQNITNLNDSEKQQSIGKRKSILKPTPISPINPKLPQILNISNILMESFNIDQLIELKLLQADLTKCRSKQEYRQIIIESQFLNSLTQIQYGMLKELNPQIFLQPQITKPDEIWSDDDESESKISLDQQQNQSNQDIHSDIQKRPSNVLENFGDYQTQDTKERSDSRKKTFTFNLPKQ